MGKTSGSHITCTCIIVQFNRQKYDWLVCPTLKNIQMHEEILNRDIFVNFMIFFLFRSRVLKFLVKLTTCVKSYKWIITYLLNFNQMYDVN